MIYNHGDIIVVPFPFVDSDYSKPRPAIILSNTLFNDTHTHSIAAMITTGINTKWESDLKIKDLENTGLKIPSVIRFKLFTLDNRLIKYKLGKLGIIDLKNLSNKLKEILINDHSHLEH